MAEIPQKNTLIGMINRKRDLDIACKQGWYRVPVKSAPAIVKSGNLSTIALYQTKVFGNEQYSVQWWGEVQDIDRKKRIELLPNEPGHLHAMNDYFMIRVGTFMRLPQPIISLIPRRNPFIITTRDRLLAAREFNELFYGSPIEERLWAGLCKEKIPVQREFMVSQTVLRKKMSYFLDFVLFCKDVNIALECDGDTYHNARENIEYDKDRDIKIQNMRFVVYRFTTDKIINHLAETMKDINKAISTFGGVVDALNPAIVLYKTMNQNFTAQEKLFD